MCGLGGFNNCVGAGGGWEYTHRVEHRCQVLGMNIHTQGCVYRVSGVGCRWWVGIYTQGGA